MTKRAQTDTVLILGLVVFIAIILLLGWTRIVSPLLKYHYTIEAYEVALGLDAAAAAPERLQSAFIIANKLAAEGSAEPYKTDRRVDCTNTEVKMQSKSPASNCQGNDNDACWVDEESTSYVNDKKLIYSCKKPFGTYSLEKTWDYESPNAQNFLRAID
ncbi:MAG: hypothetical protein HY438_02775 [DPANN group archaeon]|nr:hypothetical protein [DPANN group archaeon]